jgi:hypothetical protein
MCSDSLRHENGKFILKMLPVYRNFAECSLCDDKTYFFSLSISLFVTDFILSGATANPKCRQGFDYYFKQMARVGTVN